MLLERLLGELTRLSSPFPFHIDVVVVDNDAEQSAHSVVSTFGATSPFPVIYNCVPERNISLARNQAVRSSRGNLLALIDDDEWPTPAWLDQLYTTLTRSNCDGVLGPVVADVPPEAPGWLSHPRITGRRRLATGDAVTRKDARTGNALLRRSLFPEGETWFDPAFGRTGGEDSDFFRRQFALGRTFIWSDEAEVYETVPPERWTVMFHVRRYLRSGTLRGEAMRRVPSLQTTAEVCYNSVLFLSCSIAALPCLLAPRHVFVRLAMKAAYCAGVVAAYGGHSLLRERV